MDDTNQQPRHWSRSVGRGLMAAFCINVIVFFSHAGSRSSGIGRFNQAIDKFSLSGFLGFLALGACAGALAYALKCEKRPVPMVFLGAILGFLASFWTKDVSVIMDWIFTGGMMGGLYYAEAANKLTARKRYY